VTLEEFVRRGQAAQAAVDEAIAAAAPDARVTPLQLLEQAEAQIRECRATLAGYRRPTAKARDDIARRVAGVIAQLENFRIQLQRTKRTAEER
jgi:hypothetical protein